MTVSRLCLIKIVYYKDQCCLFIDCSIPLDSGFNLIKSCCGYTHIIALSDLCIYNIIFIYTYVYTQAICGQH